MHLVPGRRALRLLVTLLTLVGLVAVAAPASAGNPSGVRYDRSHGASYLALGDSVPFGYRGNQPPALYRIPQLFVGYPEIVGHDFRIAELNASCPGETTDSFIDQNAQSNGCENSFGTPVGYRDLYPLHVNYRGSQLQFAVGTLQQDRGIQLVTLQLGANDGFLCQKAPQPYCPDGGNTSAGVAEIAAHVGQNLALILGTLRTEGAYDGKIVVVTYYALDYSDPAGVAATQALNAAITAAAATAGAAVADGFAAFRPLALRAGGSSIAAGLVLPGDVHPTLLGQALLARAVEQAAGH